MKLMIFIDYDNFCQSIKGADTSNRREKISKFSNFITNYLSTNKILNITNEDIIRTYVYTGLFTDNLINRLTKLSKNNPEDKQISGILTYAEKQKQWQKGFFDTSINFDSFEIRTKPLQFANKKIFQKGVDVQIAVDMVSHAHTNSYDVAILCSGDVDLIESIKITKNLGKKVIICSTYNASAKNVRKEADLFIDFSKLTSEELDKFTVKK